MRESIESMVDGFEEGRINRRQLIGSLTAMLAAARAAAGTAQTGRGENTFTATGLNHIALRVTDIPQSRDFYIRHLGMSVMSESASSCFLSCGEHFVALFRGSRPGMDHYCYSVEGYSVQRAAEKLKAVGIDPRTAGNRIYFPDPDGLTVQLAAPGFRG